MLCPKCAEPLKRDSEARIVSCTSCSFGIGYQRFDEVVQSLYKPKTERTPDIEDNLSELNNMGHEVVTETIEDDSALD